MVSRFSPPPVVAIVFEEWMRRVRMQALVDPDRTREVESAFRAFCGSAVRIVLDPPGFEWIFLGTPHSVQWLSGADWQGETVDVTLSGSPVSVLAALLRQDLSGVQLTGNVLRLRDLQRALYISPLDLASSLEAIAGAGVAGPWQQTADALRQSLAHAGERQREDWLAFLQEEMHWLPAAGHFRAWAEDVADLRDAAARLEVRLRWLEARQSTPERTVPAAGPAMATPVEDVDTGGTTPPRTAQ